MKNLRLLIVLLAIVFSGALSGCSSFGLAKPKLSEYLSGKDREFIRSADFDIVLENDGLVGTYDEALEGAIENSFGSIMNISLQDESKGLLVFRLDPVRTVKKNKSQHIGSGYASTNYSYPVVEQWTKFYMEIRTREHKVIWKTKIPIKVSSIFFTESYAYGITEGIAIDSPSLFERMEEEIETAAEKIDWQVR